MELVSKKNFIILISVILIVGFALMSMFLTNKKLEQETLRQIQPQVTQVPMSDSDSPEAMQKDLDSTEIESIDKDLNEIEAELNKTY